MKLKEKFILYSNINKNPPKQEKSKDYFHFILEKIPPNVLIEMPAVGLASNNKKKPYINLIRKGKKPDLINLDKHWNDNEMKLISQINAFKEMFYEHNKERNKQIHNYGKIKLENNQFLKIYKKLKKDKNKYKTGTYLDYKPFINISNKYISKNMKIPNLSEDHNIFHGNPLILEGSELEDYFIYNLGKKDKSIKFLKKLENLIGRKKMGNYKENLEDMDNIENLKREENQNLTPEIEIPKLRKDIRKTRNSYKNLAEFDQFFEGLRKRRKLSNFFYLNSRNLKKNKSDGNIYNKINKNLNNNSTNNENSISIDNSNKYNKRKYSKYRNLVLNNSNTTYTTGMAISRKQSSLDSFKEFNINSYINSALSKENNQKKIKLSPLISPLMKPSNKFNFQKLKVTDTNNIYNIKNNLHLCFKKKQYMPLKNKIDDFHLKRRNILFKPKKLKNFSLIENNKKKDISLLNEEKENLTHDSEINEIYEINKEIGNKKNIKKNKDIKEIKKIDDSNKYKIEEDKKNKNTNNKINIKSYKENEKNINKIKNIKKDENNDYILKNINNKEVEKIQYNKNDSKEKKSNELENLFNIAKNGGINLKENKKEMEKYILSQGKDLNKLINKKDTYFNIRKLKQKTSDRNLILEEYMIRKECNIKKSFSKREKIMLEKNKSFINKFNNQEMKFKEIIIEDKIS